MRRLDLRGTNQPSPRRRERRCTKRRRRIAAAGAWPAGTVWRSSWALRGSAAQPWPSRPARPGPTTCPSWRRPPLRLLPRPAKGNAGRCPAPPARRFGHEPVHQQQLDLTDSAARRHGVTVALAAAAVAVVVTVGSEAVTVSRAVANLPSTAAAVAWGRAHDGRLRRARRPDGHLRVDGRRLHQRRHDGRQHLAVRRPGRRRPAPARSRHSDQWAMFGRRSPRSTARSQPGRRATSTATCSSGGPACTTAATARTDRVAARGDEPGDSTKGRVRPGPALRAAGAQWVSE